MKAYTSLEQSKKLAEILPIESADMFYTYDFTINEINGVDMITENFKMEEKDIPCWSLAALMELMNRNCFNVSLHCSGAEWTVSFEDSEHFKSTCEDEAIDAAFKMIVKLKEQKLF